VPELNERPQNRTVRAINFWCSPRAIPPLSSYCALSFMPYFANLQCPSSLMPIFVQRFSHNDITRTEYLNPPSIRVTAKRSSVSCMIPFHILHTHNTPNVLPGGLDNYNFTTKTVTGNRSRAETRVERTSAFRRVPKLPFSYF
jgi:hypothetical protein